MLDFNLGRAVFWSTTWGLGVALGVALGGWLTVVGGAGTPGVESLDIAEDMLQVPLAVGGVVFGLHFLGQLVIAFFRGIRVSTDSDDPKNES